MSNQISVNTNDHQHVTFDHGWGIWQQVVFAHSKREARLLSMMMKVFTVTVKFTDGDHATYSVIASTSGEFNLPEIFALLSEELFTDVAEVTFERRH